MKYKVFQYSLKVWLSSALLSPFITIRLMRTTGRSLTTSVLSLLYGCLYMILAQLFVSFIPWLIMQLFINRIANLHLTNYARLLVILACVVILPGITILIAAKAGYDDDYLTVSFGYLSFVISTAIFLFYYKLKLAENTSNHPNL
jgi:hypothetical protein